MPLLQRSLQQQFSPKSVLFFAAFLLLGIPTGFANASVLSDNHASPENHPVVSYCGAGSLSTSLGSITKVVINTINNTSSGTSGYENFTSISTDLKKTFTYTIEVTRTANANHDLMVWIDFNKDGDFDDAGEKVLQDNTYPFNATFSKSFIIPATAATGATIMRVRSLNGSNYPNYNPYPCGDSGTGQVEDYTVNIVSSHCSGTPDPGQTICTPELPAVAGKSYTLSYANQGGEDLTYQWQSSSNGTSWTSISGATQTSYAIPGLNAATWYRCNVTCTNSGAVGSSIPLQVAFSAYCEARGSSTDTKKISKVVFNTIDNSSSGTAGYEGFTYISTDVKRSLSYPIEITQTGAGNSGDRVKVWIDYNKDNDFEDPGEEVYDGAEKLLYTGSIMIPATASLGVTTMRVRLYNSNKSPIYPTPCGTALAGQVEDYAINIIANACSGTPNPGPTTISAAMPVLTGQSFTLGYTNACSEEGITYQWQKSMDGTSWSMIPGANQPSYTVSSISANTWYRCLAKCTSSPIGGISEPLKVFYSPYCKAGANTTYYGKISNVVFNSISNASTGTTDYESFLSVSTNVKRGLSYNISISRAGQTYSSSQVLVWIDYNKNGDFSDPGETVYTASGSDATLSGSITIPTTAATGTTTMRIRSMSNDSAPNNTTPCGNSGQGQVEDYTINIIANPCSGTPNPGPTTINTPISVVAGQSFTLGYANACLEEGITNQWQKSTDGTTWGIIPGANQPTYAVSSISANTWYRCLVKCISSPTGGISEALKVFYSPYCKAGANNPYYGKISNVVFNTISNASTGTTDYESFMSVSTNVNRGVSYNINISRDGQTYSSSQVLVWIDYNKNGDFSDPGETVFTAGGTAATLSGSIAIPSTAATGTTTMRIRSIGTDISLNTSPCGNSGHGQVEDYSITIQ